MSQAGDHHVDPVEAPNQTQDQPRALPEPARGHEVRLAGRAARPLLVDPAVATPAHRTASGGCHPGQVVWAPLGTVNRVRIYVEGTTGLSSARDDSDQALRRPHGPVSADYAM